MSNFEVGIVVKDTRDGDQGVVVLDGFGACAPGEVPVVFEGNTFFTGVHHSVLEVIGPENAVPDKERCGAGRGEECCRWLMMGEGGFICGRHHRMRDAIIFRAHTMGAKRNPTEAYPNCMLPEVGK